MIFYFSVSLMVLLIGDISGAEKSAAELLPVSKPRRMNESTAGFGGDSGRYFDNQKIQTFKADYSGKLISVGALVKNRKSEDSAPLVIAIIKFSGSKVTHNLGEIAVPPAAIPPMEKNLGLRNSLNIFADFRDFNIFLKQGEQYGILFKSNSLDSNYGIYGPSKNLYRHGATFRSQNSQVFKMNGTYADDFYFQVLVDDEIMPPNPQIKILVSTFALLGALTFFGWGMEKAIGGRS